PHREMPPGPEHPGLVPRLPVERDDVADRQLAAEALDHKPRLARPYDPEPEPHHQEHRPEKRQHTHPLVGATYPEDPHGRPPPGGCKPRAPRGRYRSHRACQRYRRAAIEFRESGQGSFMNIFMLDP